MQPKRCPQKSRQRLCLKCGGVVRAGTSAAIIQILFAPPTSAAMSKRAGKYKTLNADQRRKVLPMCPVPLSPMCRAAHKRPDIVPPQSRVYPTSSPPAKSTNREIRLFARS